MSLLKKKPDNIMKVFHTRINKKVLASCSYCQTNSSYKSKLKIYTTKLQLF